MGIVIRRKRTAVKKKLDDLKSGKGVRYALVTTAGFLIVNINRLWKAGMGLNDKTLQSPKISEAYKKQKKKRRGVSIIDMRSPATAEHMADYLKITSIDDKTVTVGFTEPRAQEKATYNYNKRPQFFTLGGSLEKQVLETLKKNLTRKRT
jgi:hypothetical protein